MPQLALRRAGWRQVMDISFGTGKRAVLLGPLGGLGGLIYQHVGAETSSCRVFWRNTCLPECGYV